MAHDAGEEPLPAIPRDPDDDHGAGAVGRRHALCEERAGQPLAHLGGLPVPPSAARGKVENLIGYAQVPVGIAGPLRVRGSDGEREVYVPMATTEGALVASYSRGMRLLAAGGGARSRASAPRLSQHPVLVYADGQGAERGAERAL